MDQRFFNHWIREVWAPFSLEITNPAFLLMDKFLVCLLASCFDQIKGCGTDIYYFICFYLSKLQAIDVIQAKFSMDIRI